MNLSWIPVSVPFQSSINSLTKTTNVLDCIAQSDAAEFRTRLEWAHTSLGLLSQYGGEQRWKQDAHLYRTAALSQAIHQPRYPPTTYLCDLTVRVQFTLEFYGSRVPKLTLKNKPVLSELVSQIACNRMLRDGAD